MTLLNVRAKNHPQQVGRRGADDSTDDRRTPVEVWDAWNAQHAFTLDAAASPENAKCPTFYSIENSGLHGDWSGHSVWCNPPYSDIRVWVRKAWQEMSHGTCRRVVMLLPANRTEQVWWQQHVEPFRDKPTIGGVSLSVVFLGGRMRFDRPGWTKPAKGDRPPFGLCLLIWERAE